MEKKCFKCNKVKPLELFYKNAGMKDGRVNKCMECNKNDSREHRYKNIDKIREYDRNRGNRQDSDYLRKYRAENPKKYKAHGMISNAIKTKKIKSLPCEICNEKKSVAHHDDYDFPLNVRWLCQAHHTQWHTENGEAKNGK